MKFQRFDYVRVKGKTGYGWRGKVLHSNDSSFGETYWILWDDGEETLMHGDNLEIDNAPATH